MARGPDGLVVGREGLLDDLVDAARDAATGSGAVVLLVGEAGIGKTTVARALAREVRDRLEVSWGACDVDGAAPPFWPWRDLLTGASAPLPSGRDADLAAGADRHELLAQRCDELVEAARREPRLHLIEDLQWADTASVLLLTRLGAVVAGAPLLVVATVRSDEASHEQQRAALDALARVAHVRQLAPLGDDDVALLLRDAGLEADPDLVTVVRARTGGNPLLVSELVRAAPRTSTDAAHAALATEVPSRVADLVASRLARLPEPVAQALAVAAVLGAEGDAATLAAALGTPVAELLELLGQARAARLLDAASPERWHFRHQLVRDAVYDGVAVTDRARHHAAALDALGATGTAPPSVLAHHALAALPLLDADRAVALAARAGEAAFAQHAYEEAIPWFERALAHAPPTTADRWRTELLVLCGEAERHLGATDRARARFLEAADLTDDPALLARIALGYADPGADLGIAYRTEDPMTGRLLERALAAQPEADAVTSVLLEARLAADLYFSDEPGRSRTLAESALARARRLDDPRALGAAAAVHHDAFVVGQRPLDEQLAGSEALLRWARESGSTAARLTAHRARAMDLLAAGDLRGVDAEVLAFTRLADPLGAPGYRWWPAVWSAMRALLEGRHDEAEARALHAFEIGQPAFPTLAFANLSFLLFFLRREQGRLTEMEQPVRDEAAARADIPAIRVALVLLLAELGRLAEALGQLGDLVGALPHLRDRNWPASWFQLARAAHLVGDRTAAAALLDADVVPTERCVPVSLGTVCLGPAALAAAWLHHALGDHDRAAARYEEATATAGRIGARSWLAQAQIDHARLLVARAGPGDRERAHELAAAADIGLPSIAAALREVREGLAPPGAAAATTPTTATSGGPAVGTFRRDGATWELSFAGRTVRVRDAAGLRDLRELLTRPDEAVSVLELVGSDGASPTGDRGADALDERARREVRARLRALDAAEADAEAAGDGERAALVREERQRLAEQVARDVGLRGRARRIGDPVERARKTVSTRIRRSIDRIERAHPALGRHLDRSVDTGTWCRYRPAEPVRWTT